MALQEMPYIIQFTKKKETRKITKAKKVVDEPTGKRNTKKQKGRGYEVRYGWPTVNSGNTSHKKNSRRRETKVKKAVDTKCALARYLTFYLTSSLAFPGVKFQNNSHM